MSGHIDSRQAFLLQKVDLVCQGNNLGKLEWSWFFAPSSLELRESAHKWRKAGLVVLTIEPCPRLSVKGSF
jgi:hypothetical protein